MDRSKIEEELRARFRPGAAHGYDVTMAISAPDAETVTFAVSPTGIRFDASLQADATFLFDSVETALGIVRGDVDVIAAFMDGRFRADGYLLLAFVLIGLFEKGELAH